MNTVKRIMIFMLVTLIVVLGCGVSIYAENNGITADNSGKCCKQNADGSVNEIVYPDEEDATALSAENPLYYADSSSNGIINKLNALKSRFPDEKYWNHYAATQSQCTDYMNPWDETYADSITNTPCGSHTSSNTVGMYDCNWFDGGIQCFGFASRIFYGIFGQYPSKLPKIYDTDIRIGDWVRVNNDTHSGVVLSITGNNFTLAEGNVAVNCRIKWGSIIYNKSQITYRKHATNYNEIAVVDTQKPVVTKVWAEHDDEHIDLHATATDNYQIHHFNITLWSDNNGKDDVLTLNNVLAYNGRIDQQITYPSKTEGLWHIQVYAVDDSGNVSANPGQYDFEQYWTSANISRLVTFDPQGGSCGVKNKTVITGQPYGDLPTPTKPHSQFLGWFTDPDEGRQITAEERVAAAGDIVLYAHWEGEAHTLTFDANGGQCDVETMTVHYGKPYGKLPKPIRSGYHFSGWFTSDGKNITAEMIVDLERDLTLTARYVAAENHDWVLASEMPLNGVVADEKWLYTQLMTKQTTSESSTLSGWKNIGSTWVENGSGTYDYAVFPSGYSTADPLYKTYHRDPLKDTETAASKRVITGDRLKSYIYWHWTCKKWTSDQTHYNYLINDFSGMDSGLMFDNFCAFEDTHDCGHIDKNGTNGGDCYYNWRGVPADGSWWWFRMSVYEQSYTDYKKVNQFEQTTEKECESDTEVTPSDFVTNVRHYVKYDIIENMKYGDADCNGVVNVSDALAVLKHIVRLSTLRDMGYAQADMDRNGVIEVNDALNILKYIVGLIVELPVR